MLEVIVTDGFTLIPSPCMYYHTTVPSIELCVLSHPSHIHACFITPLPLPSLPFNDNIHTHNDISTITLTQMYTFRAIARLSKEGGRICVSERPKCENWAGGRGCSAHSANSNSWGVWGGGGGLLHSTNLTSTKTTFGQLKRWMGVVPINWRSIT